MTDTEMIDWLEENPFTAYRDIDPEHGKPYDHFTLVDEVKCLLRGRTGIVKPTLRECITAAAEGKR